jgi:hypothetical protein
LLPLLLTLPIIAMGFVGLVTVMWAYGISFYVALKKGDALDLRVKHGDRMAAHILFACTNGSRAGSQRQNYLSPMRQQRCTDGNLMLGNVRHESYLLRENSESVQIDALVGWND